MIVVTEDMCKKVISRGDAFQSVEAVFAAMAKGDAWNFPVVREAIGHEDALYGFKSGFDRAGLALGVKTAPDGKLSQMTYPKQALRQYTKHSSRADKFKYVEKAINDAQAQGAMALVSFGPADFEVREYEVVAAPLTGAAVVDVFATAPADDADVPF